MEESLDIAEMSAFLKISESYALELVAAGEVPGAKIGRAWVFLKSDLVDYLRRKIRATTAEIKAKTAIDEKIESGKRNNAPTVSPVARGGIGASRRKTPPPLPDLPSPQALAELRAA